MAEFCKTCYLKTLATPKEQNAYKENKLKITETFGSYLCEGCGQIVPIVDRVEEKK